MDRRFIFAGILVGLGIASRTIWHIGENVEFVTSSALLAASYLGFSYALVVPLVIMAITDLIIGNTNIFLFTWSGYLFIGYLGNLGHLSDLKKENKILRATGVGIIASLWFYLWTNFGVWLLDSWGMYPKTLGGLLQAYFYGLPFLKMNLLGNIIFVPVSFFVVEKSRLLIPNFYLTLQKRHKEDIR